MMERPPCASPFISDTTWKQEALSRPLEDKEHREPPNQSLTTGLRLGIIHMGVSGS